MRIGVLALQGAFIEHEQILRSLGVEVCEVRLADQLEGLDGLVLPGGESTTFAKLAVGYGLIEPLRNLAGSLPMWGTCAGLVFMARAVGTDQDVLGILDVEVERNAFGRQVDSFEAELDVEGLQGGPLHGVFIRAPVVRDTGPDVDVICRLEDGRIVGVRQGILMGTSFHPELTDDDRLHRYFLDIVARNAEKG